MPNLAIQLIEGYQKYISPLFGRRCRYHPTCSTYAKDAIRSNGIFVGIGLGAWRLLRCNPFSPGGVDYPPNSRFGEP